MGDGSINFPSLKTRGMERSFSDSWTDQIQVLMKRGNSRDEEVCRTIQESARSKSISLGINFRTEGRPESKDHGQNLPKQTSKTKIHSSCQSSASLRKERAARLSLLE